MALCFSCLRRQFLLLLLSDLFFLVFSNYWKSLVFIYFRRGFFFLFWEFYWLCLDFDFVYNWLNLDVLGCFSLLVSLDFFTVVFNNSGLSVRLFVFSFVGLHEAIGCLHSEGCLDHFLLKTLNSSLSLTVNHFYLLLHGAFIANSGELVLVKLLELWMVL